MRDEKVSTYNFTSLISRTGLFNLELRKLLSSMMKQEKETKKQDELEPYRQSLSEAENAELSRFFEELDCHINLPRNEKLELQSDFKKTLLYYSSSGVSLDEALARLDVKNLGSFYTRPPILWFALDDAAKIYPLSMKHGQMAVFRLSVYLKEQIVPELLQMALTFTVKRFPTFATTVKKGIFWHYLDTAKRRYSIDRESDVPCRPLKISHSSSQSFRVLYHGKRISVELFHVLTDGTGGMAFLKTLTAEYLRLLGIEFCVGEGVLDTNEVPPRSEAANEFSGVEKTEGASGFIDRPAVQMSGKLSRTKPCRILHFKLDAQCLKAVAKSKNTTISAYILALMFVAGKSATDELDGFMNIQVPVNMRKYYNTDSLRNFSMYCGIKLALSDISDVDSIIEDVSLQLERKGSKESMTEMINSTKRMVHLMRYIPLFIKAPAAKIVSGFLGDRVFSTVLTNIGVTKFPPGLMEHIDNMDGFLGASAVNRASCSMLTFKNTTVLTITKMTADPSFEEKLYSLFSADGITTVVEGSELYEG